MILNYWLLAFPVIFTASAQILLKLAGSQEILSLRWNVLVAGSVGTYFIAFIAYSFALRSFPVSVASPATTIAAMIIITSVGVLLGESITPRQFMGICMGVASILLIALP